MSKKLPGTRNRGVRNLWLMVAGARFELWKRLPKFEFLLSY